MSHEDPDPFAAPGVERERSDAQDAQLGERGERLLARVLDNIIALGGFIPGLVVALAISWRETPTTDDLLPVPVLAAMGSGFLVFLGVSVYQWYLIATRGQTIGKRVFKLRVVKADGRAVGFVDGVILREWVISALASVPFVGLAISLIDPLMIYGAQRRCLHDLIATTKVIRARA